MSDAVLLISNALFIAPLYGDERVSISDTFEESIRWDLKDELNRGRDV